MNNDMNGILVDWQIKELAEAGMVEPFDASLLSAQSLDIRLGSKLIIHSPEANAAIERNLGPDDVFYAKCGDFILAQSIEVFNLPPNICAQYALKSSMARAGFMHALAGHCDGGWHGSVLTMEFYHLNPCAHFPLKYGMKCGQLIFSRTATPERHYGLTGRYNNDKSTQPSKGVV